MNDGGDCRTAPATPGLLDTNTIYFMTKSKTVTDGTDTQTDIATTRLNRP